MHKVKEVAHDCGLTVGVSDPCWKQLSDTGCCCGILPDDEVFGNWERENGTQALLNARDTGKPMRLWASGTIQAGIIAFGAGPLAVYKRKHAVWSEKLQENWNDLTKERGPLKYFQGAVIPEGKDANGNILYKYVGLKREYPKKTPYWNC